MAKYFATPSLLTDYPNVDRNDPSRIDHLMHTNLASMEKINVTLKNCHGIRELNTNFSFNSGKAVAIYAPNGTMKTSFARTFNDFSKGEETFDHVFPNRQTERCISDDKGKELDPSDVVVVPSYDEELQPTELTSTLLVNSNLRKEYEDLQGELIEARNNLVDALKKHSKTKQDIVSTVSRAFTQEDDRFFDAVLRINQKVEQLEEPRLADLPYDTIFNEKVIAIIQDPKVQSTLAEYVERLNELLDESEFFSRESFSLYNAENITKSLNKNDFFNAGHTLRLHGEGEPREISSNSDLEQLIADEKDKITDDDSLRSKLNDVEKALQKNADTRRFFDLVASRVELLPELANIDAFRQKVWVSYLKEQEHLLETLVSCIEGTKRRRREIEKQAAEESTQWEKVIEIFNDRFFVPFRLSAKNRSRVILGQESVLELTFEFKEDELTTGVEREDLLNVLSNGEKKALYILNVLFEVEARKLAGRETLFVIDDLADSFDYKNKYAIIQYLKEMTECDNFKLILLTHNFDFLRTVLGRGVANYGQCFMAQKGDTGVTLNKAEYIRNPFTKKLKGQFFNSGMQRIASIPFVRNIIEYTKGEEDEDYKTLTSLLHWKSDSVLITNEDLDKIFKTTFDGQENKAWSSPQESVVDLLKSKAEQAVDADEGINFENKIVLSITIRILAEKYMISEINDPSCTDSITHNQTERLRREFIKRNLGTPKIQEIIERVSLMTSENLHVNAFMYEPIIDISDAALRQLYSQVKELEADHFAKSG